MIRIYGDIKKVPQKATVDIMLCDVCMFDTMKPGLWEGWMKFEDTYLPCVFINKSE